MVQASQSDTASRLKFGFETCVGRQPTENEIASLNRLFGEFRSLADADQEAAGKLVGEPKPSAADLADTAAAVALARVLLNLDEFVTRE
jgi:hypothetical protein